MSTHSEMGVTDVVVMAQRPYENPAYPVDAYDALIDGSRTSLSGSRVTHNSATHLGAVWQATLMISGDISKLPLMLYREDVNGDSLPAKDHPAYFPVKHQPNVELQSVKFWRRALVHLLLWGNAYIWVEWVRINGQLVPQLYNLLPDRTRAERIEGTLYYITETNGTLYMLNNTEVMHIENFPDREGMGGLDPTREARDAWGLGLAKQKFSSLFFQRGGRLGGVLETPAKASKSARDQNEENLRFAYENPDAAFRTIVLREGAKFHEQQKSLDDTQMVESTRESVRDVSRWFNMAPSRLGEEGGIGYNTKAEDNRDYLDTTLSPHMAMIKAECERVLLSATERRSERYWYRYDTDAMLQPTRLERYQAHQIGIASEFLSPNEARRIEGMNRRSGGDSYGNPNINPQAHVKAIAEHASRLMKSVHDRTMRRKSPTDARWRASTVSHVGDGLSPTIDAYCSVFGGNTQMLAVRIGERLIGEYELLSRDTPKAAYSALPIHAIIERSLA